MSTISQAQMTALYDGCCEGTGRAGISGRVFEDVAQVGIWVLVRLDLIYPNTSSTIIHNHH